MHTNQQGAAATHTHVHAVRSFRFNVALNSQSCHNGAPNGLPGRNRSSRYGRTTLFGVVKCIVAVMPGTIPWAGDGLLHALLFSCVCMPDAPCKDVDFGGLRLCRWSTNTPRQLPMRLIPRSIRRGSGNCDSTPSAFERRPSRSCLMVPSRAIPKLGASCQWL